LANLREIPWAFSQASVSTAPAGAVSRRWFIFGRLWLVLLDMAVSGQTQLVYPGSIKASNTSLNCNKLNSPLPRPALQNLSRPKKQTRSLHQSHAPFNDGTEETADFTADAILSSATVGNSRLNSAAANATSSDLQGAGVVEDGSSFSLPISALKRLQHWRGFKRQ